ncbi:nitrite reductase small subunit NirD [Cyclobacterium plantarum]|uniref:Nitrite reductase small subunit NirD n=1 Tax=Cyclobacterium plantarum TaxID=2716263 RepID=A0ABX0H777_9BACT|nr:nitrite reductase small subunit NirD [Cyclobacterium plantarum]NHE56194.1 nitrite reductase small subunit NirD [Cyclobacterium plantarum]
MSTKLEKYKTADTSKITTWFKAAPVSALPENGGACIKYKDLQIAIYNFSRRNEWYACQNLCPHKMQMALSRGMIGSQGDEPKVACPFHKKTFSLKSGKNLNGDTCDIATYPIKVEDGYVYVGFEN